MRRLKEYFWMVETVLLSNNSVLYRRTNEYLVYNCASELELCHM